METKKSAQKELRTGTPLSPYAVSKAVDELYAAVFGTGYGQEIVGLRYFNVFGPRQDPNGPYAAVIPQWIQALLKKKRSNGDGKNSRDFCYVANAVQANLLAATNDQGPGRTYNVAAGTHTTLNQLHRQLRHLTGVKGRPQHREVREGDVRHSLADISLAKRELGFAQLTLEQGLEQTVPWYRAQTS